MLSDTTWRLRRALRDSDQILGSRIVDLGVRIHVVRQDLSGGMDVIGGLAPVGSLRTHEFGGLYDVRLRRFVGPSRKQLIWYLSEAQESIVLHSDPSLGQKLLVYGAMGSGKTVSLASWLLLRALEFSGQDVEIGATAPTGDRTEMLLRELTGHMRPEWYSYRAKERLLQLRNGVRIRLITTTPRSAELGSPIQGWNWVAAASDEIQDSLRANSDIEARGRRAPKGIYRRMCTATAKDSSRWRTFKDRLHASKLWSTHRMAGTSNAFIYKSYWDKLRDELSPREAARIIDAKNVGPEYASYPTWLHEENIRPVPHIGKTDITSAKLGGYHMLLGHDPGTLQDVTVMLKQYRVGRDVHWWVVDEVTTKQSTSEAHIAEVTRVLRSKWGLQLDDPDEPKVFVRCDPYGDSDARTDFSVYSTWRNAGYHILSAAQNKKGEGKGRVPKDAGIEMIGRLLCSASGKRRLFVACDDKRQPAAPRLVEALEMSERDEAGKAEIKVKGKTDLSHWPAALRYALWPYERTRRAEGLKNVEAFF